MPGNYGAVSRRGLLQVVAVGAGVLFGGFGPVSSAMAGTDPSDTAEGGQSAALGGQSATSGRLTDIAGVHAEYREAVASFPLTLPDGWSFPAESKQRDFEPGTLWERGSGEAEAYLFWQFAVATAAHEAHLAGDSAEANRLLDVLEAGYATPVRRSVIEDDEAVFVTLAIEPARSLNAAARGSSSDADFSTLMQAVAS